MIATGETHSVQEFCEIAFGHVELDWQDWVVQDERFMRPAEVDLLIGDAGQSPEDTLGWKPKHQRCGQLVSMMVESDMELVGRQLPRRLT